MRICLDPGHGSDPGAIGPAGLKEKDVVLAIAKKVKPILEKELGVEVILTRSGDDFMPLSGRCVIGRTCDLFISIHCNGSLSNAQGMEVIYSEVNPSSAKLANLLLTKLWDKTHTNRGIKCSPSMEYPKKLYVLHGVKCPSALVEVEFITHPMQESWLYKEETTDLIARRLVNGISVFALEFLQPANGLPT